MSLLFAPQIHFQRPQTMTILEPNRHPLAPDIFVACRFCQRSNPLIPWNLSRSFSHSLSLSRARALSRSLSLSLSLSLFSLTLSLSQSSRLLVTKATARAVVSSPFAASDPLASPTMVTPTLHPAHQTLWKTNNFKCFRVFT